MSPGLRNWLLLISAGLNLFLLGVLVPNFDRLLSPPPRLHFAGPGPGGMGGPGGMPGGFVQEVSRRLSPADAAAFCEAMGGLPESFLAMDRDWRAALHESQKMLREPGFAVADFQATVTRGIVARTQFEERQRDALAQAAAAMSPEGRAILGTPPRPPGPHALDRGPPPPGEALSGRAGCGPAK